ncbi:MAG TPA: hypothetical protein VF505_17365 [Thermoanaerobaculia bacterium]
MRSRWLIAAAIIALLFTLQSLRRVGSGPWGVDGSYYMQVARHVAAGDGLLTSVCVYDQGLRTLPARTNIYPLWPLLLGSAARIMPLQAAATFLPRVFFILDLVLLFALTDRIAKGYYAFAAILLLGLTQAFFSATCYPYTEGLALCCTFGALVMFDVADRKRQPIHYALCGVIAALAFLTRSQMLFVGIAIVIVLVAARTSWLSIASFCAGYAVTVLPWIVYLTTFVRPFTPAALIGMYSETPGLPAFDQHVAVHGEVGYILDRLYGVVVMFNPLSELSFVNLFGVAAFVVPAAAIYLIWRRRWVGGALAGATALTGLLLCAVLLEAHNRFFLEWLFGYRHALPFILLLVIAIVQFDSRYLRIATMIVVAISIALSVPRVVTFATEAPPEWPSPAEKQLATWLQQNDPNAIVMTTNAQVLSVVSLANFRWAACDQSPADIARVLQHVRTDYVLVYEQEQRCPFARGLGAHATPFISFGDAPNRIVLLKVRR